MQRDTPDLHQTTAALLIHEYRTSLSARSAPFASPEQGPRNAIYVQVLNQESCHARPAPKLGVKAIDVACLVPERRQEVRSVSWLVRAPEICVEVLSPSNTAEEISEKIALYFESGA